MTAIALFDQTVGLRLRHAKCFGAMVYDDGGLAFEKALIDLDGRQIVISVDDDTDQIKAETYERSNFEGWSDMGPFMEFIGSKMSWSWMARNSQGYNDVLIISFDQPIPQFLFLASASMLGLHKILQV
jgi:hypothetical protein